MNARRYFLGKNKTIAISELRLLFLDAISAVHCVALCSLHDECHSGSFVGTSKKCILTSSSYPNTDVSIYGLFFLEHSPNGKCV